MPEREPDHELRVAAVGRAVELMDAYDDLVSVNRLREGFRYRGERVSFGSFQKGIHRSQAQRGPAALTLSTSFKDPYRDELGPGGGFVYASPPGPPEQPDTRGLRPAHALLAPLVYFRALAPGQYWVVAPAFVVADPAA